MVAVPGLTPVTTPLKEPTVANDKDPLVHTPAVGEPVRIMELPVHTLQPDEGHSIVGVGFTVREAVAKVPIAK